MSIDAIKAVVDLIEINGVVSQEDIVKCLRSAIEQAERQEHSIEIRVYGQTVTFVTREPMAHYKDGDRFYRHPPQRQPLTEIAEALRRHGLTLVETAKGYDVMRLGEISAHGIGGGE